jgi:exodeoxyribonuclease VII small subunit
MTFEDTVKRIDTIIGAISSERQPLTEALTLFEEGIGLLDKANQELATIEARARELIARANGNVEEVAIDGPRMR